MKKSANSWRLDRFARAWQCALLFDWHNLAFGHLSPSKRVESKVRTDQCSLAHTWVDQNRQIYSVIDLTSVCIAAMIWQSQDQTHWPMWSLRRLAHARTQGQMSIDLDCSDYKYAQMKVPARQWARVAQLFEVSWTATNLTLVHLSRSSSIIRGQSLNKKGGEPTCPWARRETECSTTCVFWDRLSLVVTYLTSSYFSSA